MGIGGALAGRLKRVTSTHRETFERYLYAGAISRNPDAVAELFTEDGVFEAPLVPPSHLLPQRLEGREAIRTGIAAYQEHSMVSGTVNAAMSRYVLHDTTDPDVFIAEIDTVFDEPQGHRTTLSLVQIFRLRAGQIAMLRDYFSPSGSAGKAVVGQGRIST